MATKIDLRSQPRGSADGTGEVTLAELREQFRHSFVPRMSEDGTGIPRIAPKVTEARMTNARITGSEMKIAELCSITPRSIITPDRR